MIKWKKLIICILIPNALGFLGSLAGNVQNGFNNIIKPSFTPPSIVFPVAWTILYVLMGISTYLIVESKKNYKKSIILYSIQLILNASWTYFFFNLKWFMFSTILVIVILLLVIYMVSEFYKINKIAAYIQIPYILWLIFATILSYNVYLLN